MSTPKHKTKKKGNPSPSKPQSSHSSPTKTEDGTGEKLCYRLLRSLGKMLRWLLSLGTLKSVLIWASVAMTLSAGALYLLPRVTVDPSGPYDPANPSPITFTISNINIVPLRDVQPALGICYANFAVGVPMRGATEKPDCNGAAKSKLILESWQVKWLDIDEKYQIAIEDMLTSGGREQIENANITIAITYTPWRMPSIWRVTKEFRFVTKKRSDGKIYWLPIPLNR